MGQYPSEDPEPGREPAEGIFEGPDPSKHLKQHLEPVRVVVGILQKTSVDEFLFLNSNINCLAHVN